MLKFGSRTELYFDHDFEVEWQVKVGDRVKGGATAIAVVRVAADAGRKSKDAATAAK
jgi:hypothetical protein